MAHLFSQNQVDRLANRLAGDASRNRPSAMTPDETRVVIDLLRHEVGRMETEGHERTWGGDEIDMHLHCCP